MIEKKLFVKEKSTTNVIQVRFDTGQVALVEYLSEKYQMNRSQVLRGLFEIGYADLVSNPNDYSEYFQKPNSNNAKINTPVKSGGDFSTKGENTKKTDV